jgi:hypothetical protein
MGQSTVEFSKTNVAPPLRGLHVDDDASFLKTGLKIVYVRMSSLVIGIMSNQSTMSMRTLADLYD